MSSSILPLINAFVTISRPTAAQDATGHPTAVPASLYTNVPCCMDQNTTGEQVIYDADRNRYTGVAFFTTSADIRPGDTITWGTRSFEVLGVNEEYDHVGLVSHYRVEWSETK